VAVDKATRRTAILRSATCLFAEKGFREASMGEVSRLSGVAAGTVFYHFKSKEELFLTILEEVKDRLLREFEGFFGERTFDTGLDMIEGTLSFYLYLAGQMEEHFMILHRHYPFRLAEENEACRSHLEAIYGCVVETLERALQRGQEDGSVARELNTRRVSLIVFSLADGLVRFKVNNLCEPGVLVNDVLAMCRRMLAPPASCENPVVEPC
jgi:AcrR family transcriptional regulator